jgi:two-component system chemotaxis response regulator CheY
VLQQLGFTNIAEASDGAQAIASATKEKFDLIVTDYNMPLMDGLALISYLRQTPATQNVPIIMVTTESGSSVLGPVRKLGVVDVFSKEFAIDQVRLALDRLF